jgi:cyclopropane-fatty-acyl-phospholipid synthase
MLHQFLDDFLRVGALRVTYGDQRTRRYGDGSGSPVSVRLTPRGERRLVRNPQLGFGEAYMDGDLEILEGSLWDLVEMVGRNRNDNGQARGLRRLMNTVELWVEQQNSRETARRNVHHHYDLSLDLYRRFLDTDLQYSCAYFSDPHMTLEAAQAAKKAHLAAKLNLAEGQTILDIGCGWGGLALDLAGRHRVQVTGVTLSPEQLTTARSRAAAAGLVGAARFDLADYRDVQGPFDRIVSVGMLEHVGAPYLATYFEQIDRLLADDGVAVIHAIGSRVPPAPAQPFIRKHIFPGSHIPSLSEVTTAAEKAGLWITDVEILRLHYAETLRCWRQRFLHNRAEIASLFDERFCRMWEVYLCMSEMAFRYLDCMVFQIQVTKRVDALPITRDYMREQEAAEIDLRRRA